MSNKLNAHEIEQAIHESTASSLLCDTCGKEGATMQPDPYNSEINLDHTLHAMCVVCAHNSAMEI